MGLIRESDNSLPLVIVRKRDKSIRLCVNYANINAKIVNDHPAPLPDAIFGRAAGAKYIRTIEIRCAYYQIELAEESNKYTAFRFENALFEWNRLPMGLKISSIVFQRLVDRVLRSAHSFASSVIDDIMCHSNRFEEHVSHL